MLIREYQMSDCKEITELFYNTVHAISMHQEYLREVHPARLNTLILTEELWTSLADLNEQEQNRLNTIMEQMKIAEDVTEALKRIKQIKWV